MDTEALSSLMNVICVRDLIYRSKADLLIWHRHILMKSLGNIGQKEVKHILMEKSIVFFSGDY